MAKSSDDNGNGQSAVTEQNARIKPTQREQRQRFRDAMALHARGCRPKESRAALQDKWGMCNRVAGRYIRAARDCAIEYSQVPLADLIAQSHSTYLAILQDPQASRTERIAAQRAIDDLFALPKARKVAITTAEGDDVMVAFVDRMTSEQLALYDEIGEMLEAADRGETPTQLLEGPDVT